MSIPGNPVPINLEEVSFSRQQANINAAKNVVDSSLTKTQQVVNPILENSIATAFPQVPRQNIQQAVDTSTTAAKNKIQKAADKSIESDLSYGRDDSYVSRFTNWISDKIGR
ncbi:MAG: hypothetical protein WBD50_03945 [Candidatus Rhabdochlamydia sp.]